MLISRPLSPQPHKQIESNQKLKQNLTYVLEKRQHFIVRCVIRDEESQIRIVQHSRNAYQARATPRDNTHILPRILARLALSMMHIIQIGDRSSQ